MQPLFLPVLLGTGRDDRRSADVAAYVMALLGKTEGVTTELVDVRTIGLQYTVAPWQPGGNGKVGPWHDVMDRADGLLIVSPEYNRGYPGELKIVIDALDKEYRRKPVAIAGVSTGVFGGTRMILALRQVLTYLGMVPISAEMNFGTIKTLFDDNGKITDPAYDERIQKAIDELVWLARALKAAREKTA